MADHTPEPWERHDMRLRYLVLDDPDWERARACVNACAGIPTEQLAKVAGDLAAFHGLIFDIVMSDEAPSSERTEP